MGLLLKERGKVLNAFKDDIFPVQDANDNDVDDDCGDEDYKNYEKH